jgi:hypothetical protein
MISIGLKHILDINAKFQFICRSISNTDNYEDTEEEFFDENLETVFLLTMSDHVEKIHNPLNAPKQWEKAE